MKILVGYDGSNAAKDTLKLALDHAKRFGASVEVVTSMTRGREAELEEIAETEAGLAWAAETAGAVGVPCTTHLLIRGMSVGEDLVAYAEEKKVELIYVGVRRRSRVGKLILGSNAQHVILNAPCPVVTAK